ncbi:ribonuclease III domain-containing protein [Terfezia claveryi]|nr:ribonuclease III domain-containing protein [Terfezia claveryi]
MGKKRKNTNAHQAAPRPSNQPPSGPSNDLYNPPTVSPLVHKFSQLENLLAEILAEQTTDEQWREALGEGQRAEFVKTMRNLKRRGHLRWQQQKHHHHCPLVPLAPPLPPISSAPLLTQVFTHPSHPTAQLSPLTTDVATHHYNRLEFLGDSALKYILTLHLYHRYPSSREGMLTSLRSSLESNINLSTYSMLYNLPQRTLLGLEAIQAGFYTNTKFCADVLEAYIGALVIDDPTPAGWQNLTAWVLKLVDPKLKLAEGEMGDVHELDRGAREKLNLLVAGVEGVKLEYSWEGGGGGNQGGFWYVVRLTGYGVERMELGRGWGGGKGDAMTRAAMEALENKEVLEEVRGWKDKWLRGRGIEKVKRKKMEI